MTTKQVQLRLTPALIEGLDKIVKKQGFSTRQEVIRTLIRDAILKDRGIQ